MLRGRCGLLLWRGQQRHRNHAQEGSGSSLRLQLRLFQPVSHPRPGKGRERNADRPYRHEIQGTDARLQRAAHVDRHSPQDQGIRRRRRGHLRLQASETGQQHRWRRGRVQSSRERHLELRAQECKRRRGCGESTDIHWLEA